MVGLALTVEPLRSTGLCMFAITDILGLICKLIIYVVIDYVAIRDT